MRSFDDYPLGGRELLGKLRYRGRCRHGYGRDLQTRTGQTRCAYCGVSLTDDYYHWLLMCVDHVVPVTDAKRLLIPGEFTHDMIKLVLCCSGCNGFGSLFDFGHEHPRDKWTLEEFVKLRDRVFTERRYGIAERRAEEMDYFDGKPWMRRAG